MNSFGEQLRTARHAAGMTIAELARLAETSRAMIHAYEKGSVSPTVARAELILNQLNRTLLVTPLDRDEKE